MIIILDDQPHFIAAYRDTLDFEGFEVLLAQSADVFFTMLKTLLPEAVIIDVMLPSERDDGYNAGITVYERFRELFPDTPAILLTNRADLNADDIVDNNAEILCKREISPMDLLNKLSSMLTSQRKEGQSKD